MVRVCYKDTIDQNGRWSLNSFGHGFYRVCGRHKWRDCCVGGGNNKTVVVLGVLFIQGRVVVTYKCLWCLSRYRYLPNDGAVQGNYHCEKRGSYIGDCKHIAHDIDARARGTSVTDTVRVASLARAIVHVWMFILRAGKAIFMGRDIP